MNDLNINQKKYRDEDPIDMSKAHKPLDPIGKGKPPDRTRPNQKGQEEVIYRPIYHICNSKDHVAALDKPIKVKILPFKVIHNLAHMHVNDLVVQNQDISHNTSGGIIISNEAVGEKYSATQDDQLVNIQQQKDQFVNIRQR